MFVYGVFCFCWFHDDTSAVELSWRIQPSFHSSVQKFMCSGWRLNAAIHSEERLGTVPTKREFQFSGEEMVALITYAVESPVLFNSNVPNVCGTALPLFDSGAVSQVQAEIAEIVSRRDDRRIAAHEVLDQDDLLPV